MEPGKKDKAAAEASSSTASSSIAKRTRSGEPKTQSTPSVLSHRPVHLAATKSFKLVGELIGRDASKAKSQQAYQHYGLYNDFAVDSYSLSEVENIPAGVVLRAWHLMLVVNSGAPKSLLASRFPADFTTKGRIINNRPNRGRASKYQKSEGRIWFYNIVEDYPLWGDEGANAYGTSKNAYTKHKNKACICQFDEPTAD